MELVSEDKQAATLRFTKPEYAILNDILRVFEHKMENDHIDYEMLMDTKEEAQAFLNSFWQILENQRA